MRRPSKSTADPEPPGEQLDLPAWRGFGYWKLDPSNFTLHDGRGYEIDLERLTSWAEWQDWLRHINRKEWPSPEAAFRELFPKGPLKDAAAVRDRIRRYAAQVRS